MPRNKSKKKSIKGGLCSPGKKSPLSLSPNVTIDLTDSILLDKIPEIIDLDDIEDDDDEVEVVGVQVGTGAPKNVKADLSVIVIEDKPIEDKSFTPSQSKPNECPFTYGNMKKQIENLAKAQKINNNILSQTQERNEPIAKLYETKEKPKPTKNNSKGSQNNINILARQKIDNNLVENVSKAQKKGVSFGRQIGARGQKKNNCVDKYSNGINKAKQNKKATNAQNTQKRYFNGDKNINSLKFVSKQNRQICKNKKSRPRYCDILLNNGKQNNPKNFNGKSRPFVFPNSSNQNKMAASLAAATATSILNPISSNECTDGDRSECEIIGGTVRAPIQLPQWTAFGLNAYVSPGSGERSDRCPGQPRPIFIDGSNVAMAHSKKKYFSCIGIKLCIDYFIARGHKNVKAFVPQFRHKSSESRDPYILEKLEKDGLVVFTPSRVVGKRRISSYDDRYIVQCAATVGAIIVSNDNYRDLYDEEESWRETIEKRILPFTWIDEEWIMFPTDPLGRCGPPLDNFLLF